MTNQRAKLTIRYPGVTRCIPNYSRYKVPAGAHG